MGKHDGDPTTDISDPVDGYHDVQRDEAIDTSANTFTYSGGTVTGSFAVGTPVQPAATVWAVDDGGDELITVTARAGTSVDGAAGNTLNARFQKRGCRRGC